MSSIIDASDGLQVYSRPLLGIPDKRSSYFLLYKTHYFNKYAGIRRSPRSPWHETTFQTVRVLESTVQN